MLPSYLIFKSEQVILVSLISSLVKAPVVHVTAMEGSLHCTGTSMFKLCALNTEGDVVHFATDIRKVHDKEFWRRCELAVCVHKPAS